MHGRFLVQDANTILSTNLTYEHLTLFCMSPQHASTLRTIEACIINQAAPQGLA